MHHACKQAISQNTEKQTICIQCICTCKCKNHEPMRQPLAKH